MNPSSGNIWQGNWAYFSFWHFSRLWEKANYLQGTASLKIKPKIQFREWVWAHTFCSSSSPPIFIVKAILSGHGVCVWVPRSQHYESVLRLWQGDLSAPSSPPLDWIRTMLCVTDLELLNKVLEIPARIFIHVLIKTPSFSFLTETFSISCKSPRLCSGS